MGVTFTLTQQEKNALGSIACLSISQKLAQAPAMNPPMAKGVLGQDLGCFVTLNKGGHLRGCIGSLVGREPLYKNVARMAVAAAFEDHRFPAVTTEEWLQKENAISMEISVLGPMTLCPSIEEIEIGRHGLLLILGQRSGVFLPKVAVEQGWDLPAYLENLCRKAQLPAGAWQHPEAKLYWYEALVFPVQRNQ